VKRLFLLLSLINASMRWRQSAINKRNKNLHSTPLVCKVGFGGETTIDTIRQVAA